MFKKRFFLVLKIIIPTIAILLLLIFVLGDANGQVEDFTVKSAATPAYNPTDFEGKFDSLNTLYGQNKKLPDGYEIQALLALSHYPELFGVNIEFVQTETMIPLASRPKVFSKLKAKDKQVYQVIISTNSTDAMDKILLKNLPFNAQVGVLGHELGHTLFYLDKGFFDILKIGLSYVLGNYRAKFEKDTDRRAIAHGLGPQLYAWAKYVREQDDKSKRGEGNTFMDAYYLTPAEILEAME